MKVRERKAIDAIPEVTMVVRTMTGLGAAYEQFRPTSLDESGAMLLLKSPVEMDAPLRVIVNGPEELARLFALKFDLDFSKLKQNDNGSYQLFGNWLKIKWTKSVDAKAIKSMGLNKLLWEIHDNLDAKASVALIEKAKDLLKEQYTTEIDTNILLENIVKKEDLPFPLTKDGFHQLARRDNHYNTKTLYCLLGSFSYEDIVKSICGYEIRYMNDPFIVKYWTLHGTIALNQDGEDWGKTFNGLCELVE